MIKFHCGKLPQWICEVIEMKEFNVGYTAQQQYQLKLAQRQGLDTTLLENPELTYQQMEVLRKALQEGIDIVGFCHPTTPIEEMKRQIELAEDNRHIIDIAKQEYRQSKIKTLAILLSLILVVFTIGYLAYANREFLIAYFNAPKIQLTQHELTLKMSEPFHEMDYISTYDKSYELEISGIDALSTVGKHQVNYCQNNGVKEACAYLYVNVVDDVAPVLQLDCSKITINENDDFRASEHVLQAMDNVDGDLSKNVLWTNFDPFKETQEIVYTVKDQAGNTTSQKLLITLRKQAPIIIQGNSSGSSSSSSSSNGGSSSNDYQSGSIGNAYNGKFYDVEVFGSFENALNACAKDIQGRTGQCVPVQDEDGINIGYQAKLF